MSALLASVRPVRRVYLGLTADPYDALSTVAWTEITKVFASSIRWGAQHELARVEPSYCSLTLDNSDGDFEALNPASPYYPNLRPLNRLRIVDTWPANLLTANQESLETDTTGWAADTNCSIARSILAAHSGVASLALTATAGGLMVARTPTGTSGIPVTAGEDYEAHLYAQTGSGTMATSIVVRWYDAAGVFISDSGSNALTATATAFTPIGSLVTAPAGAAFAAVLPVMTAASAGHVGYLDSTSFAPAWPRFTGYVTDWPRSWTGIGSSVVQVEAYDALGAVLNAVDIPAWPWEMEIRKLVEELPAAGKAVWLRLNETTGTVAADSSGFGNDGQYQGSPTLGQEGLGPNGEVADGDKAVRFVSGSRASLPYKNLISGYPFTFACWFQSGTATTAAKMMLSAYDGAQAPFRQYVQVFISAASPGKIVATVANPYPTGTQFESTITVNDLNPHHLVVVFNSSTDFEIYIDGDDRTAFWATNAHTFPDDLNTGYAVGNNPATAFGDFRFGETADDILDEVLVLDGVALTAAQVDDLYDASILWPDIINHSGHALTRLLAALGWPSADIDIDAGLTVVQQGLVAGKALAYANRLDATEGGRLFVNGAGQIVFQDRHAVLQSPYTVSQATFGEGAGEINYVGPFNHGEDDADIYNDVRVANVGGVVQVARSKASKDRYGWKTLALTDLLGTSDSEARDRANRDLSIYAEPVTRIRSLTVKPQEDAAQGTTVWPNLLGLGQNSRVTVKATPPGAALITQESQVERLEETVTPSDWQITLGLSAAQAGEFWVLGTSELDTGTVLAY